MQEEHIYVYGYCGFPKSSSFLSGCSGLKRVEINPEERDKLRNQPEIVAVHYQTLSSLPVHRVAYEQAYDPATGHPFNSIAMEDPVRRVKDRFLHVLSQDLGRANIRSIEEARFSGPFMFLSFNRSI